MRLEGIDIGLRVFPGIGRRDVGWSLPASGSGGRREGGGTEAARDSWRPRRDVGLGVNFNCTGNVTW